jgi:squalene-hopene/tetraprenyl-beta-curcumene cyclase
MNSMELVRFSATGASRPQHPSHASHPACYSQLAAPTRSAVLRARQFLAAEQRRDGSWVGNQTGDATLASYVIFWLRFSGRCEAELLQQAANAIRGGQLAEGGWASAPGGRPDVNTSVRAYLALKLSGMAANDESLQRARRVIRRLGGADAADRDTRFALALFGQIDYDACPVIYPESLDLDHSRSQSLLALAAIWSHRPLCPIALEQGVRELFLRPPAEWKPTHADDTCSFRSARCRHLSVRIASWLEKRGWTPLRNRGIDRIGALLTQQAKSANVADLDFCTLAWNLIALTTLGYAADSAQMRRLEGRFFEMIRVDEEAEHAIPSWRASPLADTISSLRALMATGISRDHPAIIAAARWIRQARRGTAKLRTAPDICQMIQLLSQSADDSRDENPLPPRIRVSSEESAAPDTSSRVISWRQRRIATVVKSLIETLLAAQRCDGSWGENLASHDRAGPSSSEITGEALVAMKGVGGAQVQRAKQRAVAYLRARQHADGRWLDGAQQNSVRATAAAVRGLLAAGTSADDDPVAAGINWLEAYQSADGGWVDTADEDDGAAVSPTALALEALVAAGREHQPAALRAAAFILRSQNDDGHWVAGGFESCDPMARVGYRHELRSTCLAMAALSHWLEAAASTQSVAATRTPFRLVGLAEDPS